MADEPPANRAIDASRRPSRARCNDLQVESKPSSRVFPESESSLEALREKAE